MKLSDAATSSRAALAGRSRPAASSGRLRVWLGNLSHQAPFSWPGKRKRRWLVGFLIALLAYPVLGTLALWTGLVERVLKSEDLRVEIQNPAYTIWPGRVRMAHVRILVNGTTQFILEGNDLLINVRLLELLKHRVHVTRLAAHDVLYQMRVQVKDTKGIEKRIAAYPPLEDLPGANVIHEETAKKTEQNDSDYAVEAEGLDISVRELWFFEYRYLGKGTLRGGFTVGSNVMEVRTAVQQLGPGELRFGAEQTLATDLRGQIDVNIPEVNPMEHADASFMQLVSARVNLRAQIQSLANVGAYADNLEVKDGKGPLTLDLWLDKGKLGGKSHLDYNTELLRLKGNGFGVGTDWALDFNAAGSPEQLPLVRSSSKSTYVSLARGMRSFTVQLHGHREEAKLDTIQLSGATDLKSASVRMPNITTVDLDDLPAVLLPGTPVSIKGGVTTASLNLDMDHEYWVRGPLTAQVKDIALNAAGVHVAGNMKLDTELRFNPKLKTNQVQNMTLAMRDMSMQAGNRSVNGWWMNMASKRLTFWNSEPSRFEGTLGVRTKNLEPFLEALAEKDVISGIIPMLTSLDDFRASATIRSSGDMMDVALASESDVWDAAGRIYKKGDQQQMALVVGGQAVSLGIASKNGKLELMPFAKTGWLNERLAEFPKPLVRMTADKP